jgi:hypothetical protein
MDKMLLENGDARQHCDFIHLGNSSFLTLLRLSKSDTGGYAAREGLIPPGEGSPDPRDMLQLVFVSSEDLILEQKEFLVEQLEV